MGYNFFYEYHWFEKKNLCSNIELFKTIDPLYQMPGYSCRGSVEKERVFPFNIIHYKLFFLYKNQQILPRLIVLSVLAASTSICS